jgi:pSer/pThr/pTyr-binding forkhead associated (FHA) protein
MAYKIKLTISEGTGPEKEMVFSNPSRPVVGRADDCDIRFPMEAGHLDISRHHCMFEFDPPTMSVRDLGSRNGTFVNGDKIGDRSGQLLPPDAAWEEMPARELHEGDEVKIGHTVIRVAEVKP